MLRSKENRKRFLLKAKDDDSKDYHYRNNSEEHLAQYFKMLSECKKTVFRWLFILLYCSHWYLLSALRALHLLVVAPLPRHGDSFLLQ